MVIGCMDMLVPLHCASRIPHSISADTNDGFLESTFMSHYPYLPVLKVCIYTLTKRGELDRRMYVSAERSVPALDVFIAKFGYTVRNGNDSELSESA